MYDTHTHTLHSDGGNTVDEMCRAAVEKGLRGITITDHADFFFYEDDTPQRINESVKKTREAVATYGNRLSVLTGVEIGEYASSPQRAKALLSSSDFDTVLCAVHAVEGAKWEERYSKIPFDQTGTDEDIASYLEAYLDCLLKNIDAFDFDILAHLTCPARYITGLHRRPTDFMMFEDKVRMILKRIVERGIALEWNTSGHRALLHYYDAQNPQIFKLYRSLGGTLVTLGSDTHDTHGLARGFYEAKALLKDLSFEHYCYYDKRKPVKVRL